MQNVQVELDALVSFRINLFMKIICNLICVKCEMEENENHMQTFAFD